MPLRWGDDGEPAVTPTMPRQRSGRIVASPQATTRPAGILACLASSKKAGAEPSAGLMPNHCRLPGVGSGNGRLP